MFEGYKCGNHWVRAYVAFRSSIVYVNASGSSVYGPEYVQALVIVGRVRQGACGVFCILETKKRCAPPCIVQYFG